jgi:hypothetical protein
MAIGHLLDRQSEGAVNCHLSKLIYVNFKSTATLELAAVNNQPPRPERRGRASFKINQASKQNAVAAAVRNREKRQ